MAEDNKLDGIRERLKAVKDVSFTVNGGEIFGIAGIAGSGQKELLEAITGLQPVESGEIEFINPKKDRPVTFFHKSMKRVMELADRDTFHDGEGKPVSFKGMTRAEIRRRVNSGDVLFREDERTVPSLIHNLFPSCSKCILSHPFFVCYSTGSPYNTPRLPVAI